MTERVARIIAAGEHALEARIDEILRFDETGKVTSERVVMNLGRLGAPR